LATTQNHNEKVQGRPFDKTRFALAFILGARAGELMALTVPDLDFRRKTIRVNKSADDRTRQVRQPKTRKSVALLPMPSYLDVMFRDYLMHNWKVNPHQLLFPAPRKDGFARSRNNVVRAGLKAILRKLGLPDANVGLHAFRHGTAWQRSWQRASPSQCCKPKCATPTLEPR
jgi:integrase